MGPRPWPKAMEQPTHTTNLQLLDNLLMIIITDDVLQRNAKPSKPQLTKAQNEKSQGARHARVD